MDLIETPTRPESKTLEFKRNVTAGGTAQEAWIHTTPARIHTSPGRIHTSPRRIHTTSGPLRSPRIPPRRA